MPGYTRPWDVLTWLLGARDADEIDDAVRDAGTDLDERLRDILEDVEADPWILKALSNVTVVHWSKAYVRMSTAFSQPTESVTRIRPSVISEFFVAYFPIDLPVGSTLTQVSARMLLTTAGAVAISSVALHKIDALDVATVVASASGVAGAAVQDVDIGAIAETLGVGERFVLLVAVGADGVSASSAALYSIQYTAEIVWGA